MLALVAALVAPITAGTPSADAAVVALAHGDVLTCSGTVIAPHAILTAAHCLAGSPPDVVEGDAVIGGTHHPIVGTFVHPLFDPATLDHDIAIAIVDAPLAVAPLAWATSLDGVTVGATMRVIGYGYTAADDTAPAIRRTGTSRIDQLDALRIASSPAPSQACDGDSGGPALAGDRIVGVASSGDVGCAQVARHTRVDAHAAWIAEVVAQTAAGGAVAGARCWYDANCAGGAACVPARDEPRWSFCAPSCADDTCADDLTCVDDRCVHVEPSPGAFGAACDTAADCAGALCLAAVCTDRCFTDLPGFTCPADSTCQPATDGGEACFAPPPAGGGCHAGPGSGGLLAVLALVGRLRSRKV